MNRDWEMHKLECQKRAVPPNHPAALTGDYEQAERDEEARGYADGRSKFSPYNGSNFGPYAKGWSQGREELLVSVRRSKT